MAGEDHRFEFPRDCADLGLGELWGVIPTCSSSLGKACVVMVGSRVGRWGLRVILPQDSLRYCLGGLPASVRSYQWLKPKEVHGLGERNSSFSPSSWTIKPEQRVEWVGGVGSSLHHTKDHMIPQKKGALLVVAFYSSRNQINNSIKLKCLLLKVLMMRVL